MNQYWLKGLLGGLLWISSLMAWAQQDSLLYQAERLLSWKAYGRAIDAYSQILDEQRDQLTPAQKVTALSKLAYAYQQVGDNPKAERFYREALSSDGATDPQLTLRYAQTLAANGKFQEAQHQYERYLSQKDKQPDRRVPAPSGPQSGVTRLGSGGVPSRYRLEYLGLNTANEEFSPAFYRDGLVYVAGKKGSSAIETSGSGGGTDYLDLIYVPNRSSLKVSGIVNPDGSLSKPPANRTSAGQSKDGRSLGADAYTRATPNDSRTVPGFELGINIAEGLGYDARPTSAAQRFTRSINTRYHEGPVTFSRDGSRIIFTRNNYNDGKAGKSTEGVNKLKLFTATQINGAWVNVEELPFNSNEYSVGHPSLGRDRTGEPDQLLYFASDMPGGFGGTDIYVSRYVNGRWSQPVNLGKDINTKGNELFPFADDAGNLYFSTDGMKGLGKLDIFYAVLSNGQTVQRIEHLDAPINSAEDDFGIITDPGRRAGYFSSNRRAGNDDIYRFVREAAQYTCRDLTLRLYDVETDQPLDSVTVQVKGRLEGRDEQLLTTDRNGLIRMCLEGDNDFIFQASRDGYVNSTVGFTTRSLTDDQPTRLEMGMFKPTIVMDTVAAEDVDAGSLTSSRIRGVVVSEITRRPIEGVTVRLRNECDRTQREYVTGADGRYFFDLIEGCDYTLIASKPAFGTNTNRIKRLPRKAKPKLLSADLRMLSVGDVVTIDNIYYDLDRFSIRTDASRELERLVATMRKYPSLVIEIRSHTDSRGEAAYNKALSTQRAKAVVDYLASKGISRRRMTATGMGETMLVNNCTDGIICTEEEHQRNRRTEFRVLAIK
ncbi:flagellar motor protein MotB [Fibrisoma montanum]|uniref:Flagellar motor protein MotB n=1 Tax=Fibrisoma montanum TaxID=2305895 RepID=A0A418MJB7_9BACT|nr:OmpA family protein [Fibrisoma montanum]RIV27487.1 flagellar motor protein MotB [Fibrisoma montanum]